MPEHADDPIIKTTPINVNITIPAWNRKNIHFTFHFYVLNETVFFNA